MEEIITALALKNELDALRPIDKEQEAIIMQKFRLDWNYHSNHLEGNSLNYGETKALILFGITAQGKPLKDHFEMTGHNEAIDGVLEMLKGERPLTESFIRELHKVLLKESSEKAAITPDGNPTTKKINVGSYKTTPNHVKTVTGEIFRFATPEETPAMMTDLLNWYNEKLVEKDVNPIFVAAEFHYKFIRIHPFDDGNGRTARILMNFILMQFGFPPVIIKSEDKENYFAVLQIADAGNIEPFVFYIAKNLVRSLEIMISGAKGESVEEPDDLDKEIALLEQKLSSLGEKAEYIKGRPAITELIKNDMAPLMDYLEMQSEKFKGMYVSFEAVFCEYLDEDMELVEEHYDLEDFLNNFEENSNDIQIELRFQHFNRLGFDQFGYETSVIFELSFKSYIIFVDGAKFSEKPYGSRIIPPEMERIAKIVKKNHLNFIEDKIAEKG